MLKHVSDTKENEIFGCSWYLWHSLWYLWLLLNAGERFLNSYRLLQTWHVDILDNSGTVDYGEFIAATLHLNKMECDEHLFSSFSYFDKDGIGKITLDELHKPGRNLV